MSKKDISRSSLEGGRSTGNKWARNESHRNERAKVRNWLAHVKLDVEFAEGSDPKPREVVMKDFTDKLNPAYRWMASKAGQPWSKVFSELNRRFDVRTLQGYHIVIQHLLSDVEGGGTEDDGLGRYRTQRFYIDEDDILHDRGEGPTWYGKDGPIVKPKYKGPKYLWVADRVGKRIVFDKNGRQFWGVRNSPGWVPCDTPWGYLFYYHGGTCEYSRKEHRRVDITPSVLVKLYNGLGEEVPKNDRKYRHEHWAWKDYKKGRVFTKGEARWWASIAPHIRKKFSA